MGVKPAEVGSKKVRKINKRCTCGDVIMGCQYAVGGKSRLSFRYHCPKCDKFWTKEEAKLLETIFVYS